MSLKVAKFGGSSLADAQHFQNAANIIKADSERKYIVVSAPGKRSSDDIKITDLLLESLVSADRDCIIDTVAARFQDIIRDLKLELSIEADVVKMKEAARLGLRDFLISRGEYLSAKIMAALLGYDFIDACEAIRFDAPYRCNWAASRKRMSRLLKASRHAVIPGFYGGDFDGNICTFLRGGSDITGAIVADAAGADLYENWTDVSGVMAADPRIIANPQPIQSLTYEQLRTFAHLGAEVLHEDAVLPCKRTGIPIIIKNSNRPADKGTMVVSSHSDGSAGAPVAVGVKKGMSMLSVCCHGSTPEIQAQIRRLVYASGVCVEHLSVTADCVSVIAASKEIQSHETMLRASIAELAPLAEVAVKHDLAMVGAIGKANKCRNNVMQTVAQTLDRADISVDLLDHGFDHSSVIAIIEKSDCIKAVNSIYTQLIHRKGNKRHFVSQSA